MIYSNDPKDRRDQLIADAITITDLLSTAGGDVCTSTYSSVGWLLLRQLRDIEEAAQAIEEESISIKTVTGLIESLGKELQSNEAKMLLSELAEDIRERRWHSNLKHRRTMKAMNVLRAAQERLEA